MDVFELRNRLIRDYSAYVESFIKIREPEIKRRVDASLDDGLLWPDPLIQLNPSFEPGESIDDLVQAGILQPPCAEIFRRDKGPGDRGSPMRLHRHQADAVRIAQGGHNYVLTTGTGSGKSLSYIVPIVDRVLRERPRRGVQAIVVYPMNALVNSQANELRKFLEYGLPADTPRVTFGQYTGQERGEERLLAGNSTFDPVTRFPAFAFRLHQFTSRCGTVYATREAESIRYDAARYTFTLRGGNGR